MSKKRFRVNDLVKYSYSEIGEYIDENHTDSPLRNDEVVELLNELHEENEQLKIFLEALKEELSLANRDNDTLEKENEQLKQVAKDFAENPTQHNLWKLRTVVLKDSDVE